MDNKILTQANKNIFGEINSTGFINNEKIATPGSFIGPTIVEKKMLISGILGENGGFSFEKSSEIIKKGKL